MENIELILKELKEAYKRSYKKLASPPSKARYLSDREKLEALLSGEFSVNWELLDSTKNPIWTSAINFRHERIPSDPQENKNQIELTRSYKEAMTELLFGNHRAAKEFLEKN